jgi:predicted 3-demethylubiquinone-9 3-methyltransferase (glyoxalase superfamily)
LWFDHQAEEAATFTSSIFKNSKISPSVTYGEAGQKFIGQEAGTALAVSFELEGQSFSRSNARRRFS